VFFRRKPWFVLHSKGLSYYRSEKAFLKDKSPLGVFPLDDDLFLTGGLPDPRCFRINCHEGAILAKAKTDVLASEWLAAFTRLKQQPGAQSIDDFLDEHENAFLEVVFKDNPWDHLNLDIRDSGQSRISLEVQDFLGPKKATIETLIQMLTSITVVDFDFRSVFLLNHGSFMESQDLCHTLINLHNQDTTTYFDAQVCIATRLHVLCILSDWMEHFHMDFIKIQSQLTEFVEQLVDQNASFPLVIKGQITRLGLALNKAGCVFHEPKPLPTTDNFLKKFVVGSDLSDHSATSIARELMFVDYANFAAIQSREFTRKEWKRKGTAHERAPNIIRMVRIFNRRSYWVATQLLRRDNLSKRAGLLGLIILCIEECCKLRNYYAGFSLLLGLGLGPIYRLKQTWNALDKKFQKKFEILKRNLSSDRDSEYHKMVHGGMGEPMVSALPVIQIMYVQHSTESTA
jgi:hypothetical protein